jgi:hypothetical protein
MIDQVDVRLAGWVSTVLGDAEVSFAPPGAADAAMPRVHLYLLSVEPLLPSKTSIRRPPMQAALRYLVTLADDDPARAHRQLGDLLFAAMENPDLEVDYAPLPPDWWAALRVTPQPAFILRTVVSRARPEFEPKLVREPLVANIASVTSLHGIVLGPGDQPIYGALVEIPHLQLQEQTDRRGYFQFAAVPGESFPKNLSITAKGKVMTVVIDKPSSAEKPILIRFETLAN